MSAPADPWIYFYEDFLAAYDPKLRKDAGAYYTPVEVVHAQVRLIDDLIRNRLQKPLGFADPQVVTLDPAVGTGTYLLGVVEHALADIEEREGAGAVPARASELAKNLYGFEIMVGPFAVSELRVSRAIEDKGGSLPADGTHVFLTDTLESPHTTPPQLPLILRPIADQHARALRVKERVPVIVCLGNPPYDRTPAADDSNRAATGGWVRYGDDDDARNAILEDFVRPASDAGHGVQLHNLYNLYVYFWRWALWKVFEHYTASGPGVVSYISASSYLDGDAFSGMRRHLRMLCDEIWIIDLGGEGRGPRRSENIFAIQTPVAIAIAATYGSPNPDVPADVHYLRIEGTAEEKRAALDCVHALTDFPWKHCPKGWLDVFRPEGVGAYFDWPLVTDLLPWQHSGVQVKRTWPIAADEDTLRRRWRQLLNSGDRSIAFHGTGDREVYGTYRVVLSAGQSTKPIAELDDNSAMAATIRYAYRSFDRQYLIADGRLISRPRPDLWFAHSDRQIYLGTLLSQPLGNGPAVTATSEIPDLDHFRGSYGAKHNVPLYRNPAATEPNVAPDVLEVLAGEYAQSVSPEDFVAYVYALLAQPAFTRRYAEELDTRELRVPLTRDPDLFARARDAGARLLWLHTYGERFVPEGRTRGQVPQGRARCIRPVPATAESHPRQFWYNDTRQTLHVGEGEFATVDPEVYEFEVSGLKVVQSWLKYRMRNGGGRRSSPLDEIEPETWPSQFTTELLELLWVLEATLDAYPELEQILSAVVEGPCFAADELPPVPEAERKPPSASPQAALFAVSDES